MNQLELQAYRLVKRRFKINRQKDLIKVFEVLFSKQWYDYSLDSLS